MCVVEDKAATLEDKAHELSKSLAVCQSQVHTSHVKSNDDLDSAHVTRAAHEPCSAQGTDDLISSLSDEPDVRILLAAYQLWDLHDASHA